MSDRVRRLPRGGTTRDVDVYLREWEKLTTLAEQMFPGYKVDCYDPGVRLTLWEHGTMPHVASRVVDYVSLSVRAIDALGETIPTPGRCRNCGSQGG